MVVKEFVQTEDGKAVDLHPDRVSNLQMCYVFEELVRKFNEQANEEAGDHFTPLEVIKLMASLVYTDEEDVYKSGIIRTIYDRPAGAAACFWFLKNIYVPKTPLNDQGNKKGNLKLFLSRSGNVKDARLFSYHNGSTAVAFSFENDNNHIFTQILKPESREEVDFIMAQIVLIKEITN